MDFQADYIKIEL